MNVHHPTYCLAASIDGPVRLVAEAVAPRPRAKDATGQDGVHQKPQKAQWSKPLGHSITVAGE